jgi:uncharacterized protein (UPF0276 family)
MKLAVNYSLQTARLVRDGVVDLDLYKVPDLPDVIQAARAQRPCYVHFPFRAGRRLADVDWERVRRTLESSGTPWVNMHLAPCAADFPGMRINTRDPADRARLIDAMKQDAMRAVAQFGPDRVALENVMWDPDPPWQIPLPALQPDVIAQVVRDTGCRFIFDLSHAWITARHIGIEPDRYVAPLPMDRLCELHISGTQLMPGGSWQDHRPMREEDWQLVDWAMSRIHNGDWATPEVVTLEYGGAGPGFEHLGKEEVLAVEIPRLRKLMNELAGVVARR